MRPFTLTYAPKSLHELVGRQELAAKLLRFADNYKLSKKKAILLHGPSGCGKTSLVVALAKHTNSELFELNASDQRNKKHVEETFTPVLSTQSFFSSKKIVLLDEVDGLSGTQDRGGAKAVADAIKTSKFPVIMTANDGYSDKLKPLRKVAEVIEVLPLDIGSVTKILQRICSQENITADESVLGAIARKNAGDIRGSVADLQILAATKKELVQADLESLSDREKVQSMQQAMTLIFKTSDPKVALTAFDHVQEDFNGWFNWVSYNMPKEYTKLGDRARAYGVLSRVDMFKSRIRKRQYWRLLVYVRDLLTAGVAVSKAEPYRTAPNYKESSRGLSIWMARNKAAKRRNIAAKIANATHQSATSVMKDFPFYVQFCKNAAVQNVLDLDDEEIKWMKEKA